MDSIRYADAPHDVPREHVCVLYHGPAERDRLIVPYLTDGLRSGHKCVAAVNDRSADRLLGGFPADVEVMDRLEKGQLDVRTAQARASDAECTASGAMLAMLEEMVRAAVEEEGYDGVRLSAEASWWLPHKPRWSALTEYESGVNRFCGEHARSVWCLYDLSQHNASLAMDVIRTHPKVLASGLMLDNPYHQSSEAVDPNGDRPPGPGLRGR